jgi:hypothetical protein
MLVITTSIQQINDETDMLKDKDNQAYPSMTLVRLAHLG